MSTSTISISKSISSQGKSSTIIMVSANITRTNRASYIHQESSLLRVIKWWTSGPQVTATFIKPRELPLLKGRHQACSQEATSASTSPNQDENYYCSSSTKVRRQMLPSSKNVKRWPSRTMQLNHACNNHQSLSC